MTPFVHLHVHSQYSILDGQASISTIISKAMDDGMPGIALTDHGAMFGIKEFYNTLKAKKKKIKSEIADVNLRIKTLEEKSQRTETENKERDELISRLEKLDKKIRFKGIIGCEAYCAKRRRTDKDKTVPDPYRPSRSVDISGWHIILLAKNFTGYKNLIKMVSIGWTEGYYYRPRIDKELLEKYHEGIIVSSACLGGEIPQHIMNGRIDEAEKSVQWFKSVFGNDFYLEIQRHKTDNPLANRTVYPEQQKVNRVILELADKYDVKVIATNDAHFANEEDAEAHDRLICISTGRDIDDPNRLRYTKQEWLKTTAEMNEVFSDLPETLSNTIEILDKVEDYSIDNEPLMPDFEIPKEFGDENEYLKYLTYEGANKKYGDKLTEEVRERIDFELDTIKSMGFPGYFLIVQDFISAARNMGVFVGPGRGSAAGSAVAYCLGITNIDPIKYDLLFERFLNPDRISMPDIDIDFDDDGRGEVLQWVTQKYGKERVAHIITYGTMATKSSIKDVARVTGLPLSESNRLSKLVPDKIQGVKNVSLKEAIKAIPELREAALSTDPKMRETIKYAQQLEGSVRNTGVHACGIIIGKTDINEIVPVSIAPDKETGEDQLVTQYEGSVIEQTGLIKMDFLGLKTLSIIKEAIENIKERGINVIDDIEKISLYDDKTYDLYSQGKTIGTFQFESAGMQKYLKELKPTKFEDLIAMNALYRPGPMEYIPQFIKRKHGLEPIEYDLPCMERYLKDTYGITIYQEQVMLLSREIAGFTRGESDSLRKAMGKKLIDQMNSLRAKFISGGTANGYEVKTLEKIWADWEKFASYAFNKSHATCYSWIAYQTAYLKANYPSEYMAGALSRNLNRSEEISKLMEECKAMGIKVLVPDVNESNYKFSVNSDGDIRFGLTAIKGVGKGASENLIEERRKNGPFKDIFDFFERISINECNKKVLEGLCLSGAFDCFSIEREVYFAVAEGQTEDFLTQLIKYSNTYKADKMQMADSLFGFEDDGMELPKPEIPVLKTEYSLLQRLNKERELVGMYLSDHPLEPYRLILEAYCNCSTEKISTFTLEDLNKPISFGGMITNTFEGMTKRNQPYGKITVEDTKGTVEIPLWGNDYLNYRQFVKQGLFVMIDAVVSQDFKGDISIKISSIKLMNDDVDSLISNISLKIDVADFDEIISKELSLLINANAGNTTVTINMFDSELGYDVELLYPKKIKPTVGIMDFCRENNIIFIAS